MSAYAFRRDAGEFEHEAWRPLDRAVYRWVITHGGSPVLARYAAWASLMDGNGETALSLATEDLQRLGIEVVDDEALEVLRADAMVGEGGDLPPRPFVLDEARRFYLNRNHANECRAAHALSERRAVGALPQATDDELDALFAGRRDAAVRTQREAVRRSASHRLLVLSGGPGTGKTTTVLRMLALLQHRSETTLAIQAAAPTGKAAQRLGDALRGGRAQLQATLPAAWAATLDALPEVEPVTVHRLLGFDPQRNGFRRGPGEPIAADVVVVDEASMLDLAALRTLLDATPPAATLILVGDPDQLTSVAAGSVLMDLVSALNAHRAPELLRLAHSFRAERHLVSINEAVRSGDAPALASALDDAGLYAVRRSIGDAATLKLELRDWAQRLASALPRPTPDADDLAPVRDALRALSRTQLLCALRDEGFGAVGCNRVIEQHLRRAWKCEGQEWYAGRAVLITRNDYASGLFNGDVGLCLAEASGTLRVWFDTPDGPRAFAPSALPPHESAFAITIHKSQGSEYDRVAVLLPPGGESRVLSRQLLYTAVSRARQAVELWCDDPALSAALAQPVQRAGGLADRLRAAAG